MNTPYTASNAKADRNQGLYLDMLEREKTGAPMIDLVRKYNVSSVRIYEIFEEHKKKLVAIDKSKEV